jgi:signal transduction histidine kinase
LQAALPDHSPELDTFAYPFPKGEGLKIPGAPHAMSGGKSGRKSEGNRHPLQMSSVSNVETGGSTPIYLTLDPSGVVLAVNSAGAGSLGYPADMITGRPLSKFLHPSDRIRLKTELLSLNAAESSDLHSLRLIHRNETVLQCEVSTQPLYGHENSHENGHGTKPLLLLICTPILSHSQTTELTLQQQAEEVLRQQAGWEKVMRAIAQPVRQSLDLRQILHTLAIEVRHILEADRVLFYRIHPNGAGSIITEAVADGCPTILGQPQLAVVFHHKYRQLKHLNQVYTSPALDPTPAPTLDLAIAPAQPMSCPTEIAQSLGIKAEIIVPIVQQGEPWGLLIVHQCQTLRHWQRWELELLKQLATHLESVIHQTELYQQVQRLNANLERQIQARTAQLQLAFDFEATLKRITDKVRDSLEEDQILETAVEELVRAIGISCCNAALYDLDSGTSMIRYEYTTTVSPYQGRIVQLDAFPELYSQLFAGQAFQFCSLVPNPVRGRVAMLTCPIVDDQGALGDLWLINHPYYGFNEQDIRLVQQVANQCAIAIRQARLYQAAQAQVEELERLNRLKDDFLSTVSHELRTPMANIKMAIQMLEVNLKQTGVLEGESNQRTVQYFRILQAECQREISLINDLLDLSRLDAELDLPQLTTIELPDWIAAIAQPFTERASNHQQQLLFHFEPHLPALTTDASYLERILTELLHNACKYTPAGETITVSVRLSAENAAAHASTSTSFASSFARFSNNHFTPQTPCFEISVSNSGVEIPVEELPRIFEKFYRIPNNDPWQHGGTGLGLALVKKLAEHLGGNIQSESASGQTCFTLQLPLQSVIVRQSA